MDSEALGQIKRVAKEAAEEVVDNKLGDMIDYKLSSLVEKIEYKIGPLAQKISSVHDLCTALLRDISSLESKDMSQVKTDLERIKRVIDKPLN